MSPRTFGARSAPVLALSLALVLAGCGSGPGATSTADGELELGPLDEFFEKAYGSYDEDQMVRDMQRTEEIIAECMAEEGFEYIPVDHSQGMVMSSEEIDIDWGSREFAAEFGYGITTNPWGDEPQDEMPIEEEWIDPNADYIESMSETEMEAYYLALYGDQEYTDEEIDGEWVYDWKQNGCQGRAQHEIEGDVTSDPALTSLEEEMNALWERTADDPRVSEANAEWVDCMAGEGFSGIATVEDASELIYEKSNAVYEEAYGEDSGEMSEEDWLAIEAKIQDRLAEITDEEIRTAVADWDCRDKVGYDETMTRVSNELQQEFVDTHRDELDAWVEAVSGGRA